MPQSDHESRSVFQNNLGESGEANIEALSRILSKSFNMIMLLLIDDLGSMLYSFVKFSPEALCTAVLCAPRDRA